MKVPEGWKYIAPKFFISLLGGCAFSSHYSQNKGIKWLKIANVGVGKIKWDVCSFLPESYLNEYSKYKLKAPDIVVALTRPTLDGKLKIARLCEDDGVALLNQRVGKVICNEFANEDFVFQLLNTQEFAYRIDINLQGTDPPNLSVNVLRDFNVLLPTLPEQRKIADILSTWDKAIETQKKLIANSEKIKKSLMQQLLTGKKRIKGFSGAWEEVKLGDVGVISSAGVDKKIVKGEAEVRLLNFVDVFHREKIFDCELKQYVSAPEAKIEKCNVQKGDIFFTPSSETRADLAMSAVACEDMIGVVYSYHIIRFRLQQKWDMNFCSFIFQTDEFRKQAYRLGDGSGQRYVISQDGFRNIRLKVPCLDEQKEMGTFLNNISQSIIKQKQKLEILKQEKSALMQQLLTGKKRVKIDAFQEEVA